MKNHASYSTLVEMPIMLKHNIINAVRENFDYLECRKIFSINQIKLYKFNPNTEKAFIKVLMIFLRRSENPSDKGRFGDRLEREETVMRSFSNGTMIKGYDLVPHDHNEADDVFYKGKFIYHIEYKSGCGDWYRSNRLDKAQAIEKFAQTHDNSILMFRTPYFLLCMEIGKFLELLAQYPYGNGTAETWFENPTAKGMLKFQHFETSKRKIKWLQYVATQGYDYITFRDTTEKVPYKG